MTDKAYYEKATGWHLSDDDVELLSLAQEQFFFPTDQLVALLHATRETTPLTAADFQEDRAPKRKRIHDRRPWPVPKRKAF